MIPFDELALLVMLVTFYPVVGPAALQRARAERPAYFAGGEIRGTDGDKLWLADGRKYDLIFKVGAPDTRWQVLLLPDGSGPGGPDDPFALEDGPIAPIDLSAFPALIHDPIFAPLVAGALDELAGVDAGLLRAHATITEASDSAPLEAVFADTVDPAAAAADGQRYLLDSADPSDLLATSAGHGAVIDARESGFPPTPDEIGPVPEPPATPPPDMPVPDAPLP